MAKILLIDDSATQLVYFAGLLRQLEHKVVTANSLEQAKEIISVDSSWLSSACLAFVEILMFKMNGFQLSRCLFNEGVKNIVLLSASGEITDRIWAQKLNIKCVLERPCSIEQLEELVNRVVPS